jgi:predicted membrane protein
MEHRKLIMTKTTTWFHCYFSSLFHLYFSLLLFKNCIYSQGQDHSSVTLNILKHFYYLHEQFNTIHNIMYYLYKVPALNIVFLYNICKQRTPQVDKLHT